MITCTQVSVGTTATKLCDITSGLAAIISNGATAIVLGTSNAVTTGNGAPLAIGAVTGRIEAGSDGGSLWAITSAGTSVVGVILHRLQN